MSSVDGSDDEQQDDLEQAEIDEELNEDDTQEIEQTIEGDNEDETEEIQHSENEQEDDKNEDEEDEEEIDEEQQPDDQEEKKEHDVDLANPLDEDSLEAGLEAAQNLTQEDVFGDDLDDLSEDEGGVRRKKQRVDASQDQTNGNLLTDDILGDEDELAEEKDEEEQVIVDTPAITCDLGREIHLVKLPSFMNVEPRPFDPQYFNEEIRDDDDEENKARLKLKLENTIRWRFNTNENGELTRESNTRLVRWSDGSLSLHLGNEIFDVYKTNIEGDHNHLFVRHQKSMQGQAVFRTKLSFRHHSQDSFDSHLKIKFASKANPAPKVRVLSNPKTPIANSIEMIRKEEQRMRSEERRRNHQLRQRERA
ncbi:unnamed protein product, partial [Didymodactylos carnosus]